MINYQFLPLWDIEHPKWGTMLLLIFLEVVVIVIGALILRILYLVSIDVRRWFKKQWRLAEDEARNNRR